MILKCSSSQMKPALTVDSRDRMEWEERDLNTSILHFWLLADRIIGTAMWMADYQGGVGQHSAL